MDTKGDLQKVEVTFEGTGLKPDEKSELVISGVNAETLRQPDKIRQLMDLLELPKGTNARVLYTTSDVIVR